MASVVAAAGMGQRSPGLGIAWGLLDSAEAGVLEVVLRRQAAMAAVGEPLFIFGQKYGLTASVGISLFPGESDSDDASVLLGRASAATHQTTLEVRAIEHDEFVRHYQAWRNAGFPAPHVAVNLSPCQFKEAGLARRIEEILAEPEGVAA